ncbi:MAG TPA: FGGY family carbohydrate kinase [Candidatus Kapabacteria bacterium]|nr:FGGY family carbohydrate kinase [Candidatus Kapabacteria bacterium]
MNAVMGIDIGSSAIKAVLFDADARVVIRQERRPLKSRVWTSNASHFEEDPIAIRDAAFGIIHSLADFAKEHGHEVKAIAFTGQMHGGLLIDATLRPLTNFITWQDKRGDEIHEDGRTFVESLRLLSEPDPTGVGIHTGFLISTLNWLRRHDAIPMNSAKVLGIYDWLTSLLVGRPVADISSAAAWGMFDPVERSWRNELLVEAGISHSLLPEVVESGAELGSVDSGRAAELGLDPSVRVHASIGDTQAAYLGSECMANEILLNFGTGSQSMWETTNPVATEGTDIRYLRNGRYLACAPTLAGGEAYRIVTDFFREAVKEFTGEEIPMERTRTIMDRLALNSDSLGIVIDPIFRGSKFRPDKDRGSIAGITSENFHPGPLVRAVVEGMIEEVAWPYFLRESSMVHTGIVGAGSALRGNPALRDAAEKRFGRALRLGRFEEEAAVGAAMLCLLLENR